MNTGHLHYWILSALVVSVLGGCGNDSNDATAEKLLRQQQMRESIEREKPKSKEEQLDQAQRHLDRGDFAAAERDLRALLISHPEEPDVLFLSAKCRIAAGDLNAACEILDGIPQENSSAVAKAALLASEWLIENRQFDQAQKRLEDVLSSSVGQDDSYLNDISHRLASLLNNQGRRIEAAKYLRLLAGSGDITEKELFGMNTFSDAFIDISMPKPDFSRELSPAALAEAKRLRGDGDLQKARRLVDILAENFPQSPQIVAFQCRLYAEMNLDDLLAERLRVLPTGIRDEPEYWFATGILMQRLQRHREAIRCLAETVKRDETDRIAYLALARSLRAVGKEDESRRANRRFELLYEAANINANIGRQPGTHAELSRLASILDELNRPWEAISWREVDLKMHGGLPEQRKKLREDRKHLADVTSSSRSDHEATCGIDLSVWPEPDVEQAGNPSAVGKSAEPKGQARTIEIALDDVAAEVGLDFTYNNSEDPTDRSQLLHQMTGGGIAVLDFDLDGCPDLYLMQGGGDAFDSTGSEANQLYRNLNCDRWRSVTSGSGTGDRGYGQGAAIADLNQDGFPDIVVANIGDNICFVNNGDGTFHSRALTQTSTRGMWTSSIACGDLSGDHLPEIVEVNYIDDPAALTTPCTPQSDVCNPSEFRPANDRVWQVGRDGSFRSWDGCLEIDSKPNYGFGGIIANFDGRNGNDLFIANDTESNHYWVSAGRSDDVRSDGPSHHLVESAKILGCALGILGQRQGCMGIASGDFDHNGVMDLHVSNFWNQAADLYLQDAKGVYTNANSARGIYQDTRLTVGWGTQAVDVDRDGWLDLAVLNGNLTDQRWKGIPFQMLPQFFRGGAEGFRLETPEHPYWSNPTLGRTMAVLDWNQDRKPDLVTNHLDQPIALLENRTAGANGVQFELVGVMSERDAIGAEITLVCQDQTWTGWVTGGDGFLCTNEAVVDFGIAQYDQIDSVEIKWPFGTVDRLTDLSVNQRYLVVEGENKAFLRQ